MAMTATTTADIVKSVAVTRSLSLFVAVVTVAVIVMVCGHHTVIVMVCGRRYYGHHCIACCGRHCHGLWPSLLWPSASTLWPSLTWLVAVTAVAIIVYPVAIIVIAVAVIV